jgi:DNA polymerase-3 subunit alpha
MSSSFIHLHLHDQYSVLDGLGKAKDYCARARELGMSAIALTNHGNVDGCIQWQKHCKEVDIKPIFGVEAYIVKDLTEKDKESEKRFHITLLARTLTGWQNILKMLTVANAQGFYYKPRIDFDLLFDHCDGLAIGSACASSYLNMEDGIKYARKLKEKGALVYLELMPIDMDLQRERNAINVEMASLLDIPLIATNDCHYVDAEDKFAHEVLLAMQAKKKWNDPKRWRFDVDTLYLQSLHEMEMNFRSYSGIEEEHWGPALANTEWLADQCNVSLDPIEVKLPKIEIEGYEGQEPNDQLFGLVMDGFDKKMEKHPEIANKEEEYLERIAEELGIITTLGFSSYFLIVFELINWCHKENIMTGPGRGSVGGSLVAYCLGITKVDPLKYDLVFSVSSLRLALIFRILIWTLSRDIEEGS